MGLGDFLLLFEDLLEVIRVEIEQFLLAHLEDLKLRDFLLDGGIIDGLGMQLLLDVVVETHFLHHLDIARTRSEGDAVEDMNDGGVVSRRFLGMNPSDRRDKEQKKQDPTKERGE